MASFQAQRFNEHDILQSNAESVYDDRGAGSSSIELIKGFAWKIKQAELGDALHTLHEWRCPHVGRLKAKKKKRINIESGTKGVDPGHVAVYKPVILGHKIKKRIKKGDFSSSSSSSSSSSETEDDIHDKKKPEKEKKKFK